jgi:citrate synthase
MVEPISSIDVKNGVLRFRGHVATTIAFLHDFETVLYLLIHGELPPPSEKEDLLHSMQAIRRNLLTVVSEVLERKPQSPEDALQVLAGYIDKWFDEGVSLHDCLLRFVVLTPLVLIGQWRESHHQEVREPTEKFGHSGNILHSMGFEIDFVDLRDFDAALILHMDDPDNPSLTELEDSLNNGRAPGESISRAIQKHGGPLHHGAGTESMKMIEDLRKEESLQLALRKRVDSGQLIFGLGHRIYQTLDPRAKLLKTFLERRTPGTSFEWLVPLLNEVATIGAEIILEKKNKVVHPNVDLFNAAFYSTLGFPIEFNTHLFAISRVAGWMAHSIEWYNQNSKQ